MIALLLSLLGVGGLLGGATYLFGPATMLAFGGKALTFLKGIPWQVYAALAAIALILFGVHWVKLQVRHADATGYARAKDEDKAAALKILANAKALRANVENLGRNAAQKLMEEHNAETARIRAAGADLVRDGPGKARCGQSNAPIPGAVYSGQKPAGGTAANAVGPVSGSGGIDLIAVPFNDFVRVTGQCDINRDEALKARANDDQQRAIWENYRKSLAAPPK